MNKLPLAFYQRMDVLLIARELLGKLLVTNFEGKATSGRIVETEAYNGVIDKASHAFSGRRTNRTEVMFAPGGIAYVYLCYGIHHLFNVVTNVKGTPHAVLIRGIEPVSGMNTMLERMGKSKLNNTVGKGPGNVSKALGIQTSHTGFSLQGDDIFIADDGFILDSSEVGASPRIGVDYAGDDAKLNYRFYVKANPFVSGKKNT
jgi:DNA-3-methyladenine glycosylase